MRKVIYAVLAALTILTFSVKVYAAHSELHGPISPQFTHISHVMARLSISVWGEANCSGSVALYSRSDTAVLIMELQRQDGSGWSTVKSWTSSGPGLPGVYMDNYHWVTRGTYRVRCIARAHSASGVLLEEVSILSHEVTN